MTRTRRKHAEHGRDTAAPPPPRGTQHGRRWAAFCAPPFTSGLFVQSFALKLAVSRRGMPPHLPAYGQPEHFQQVDGLRAAPLLNKRTVRCFNREAAHPRLATRARLPRQPPSPLHAHAPPARRHGIYPLCALRTAHACWRIFFAGERMPASNHNTCLRRFFFSSCGSSANRQLTYSFWDRRTPSDRAKRATLPHIALPLRPHLCSHHHYCALRARARLPPLRLHRDATGGRKKRQRAARARVRYATRGWRHLRLPATLPATLLFLRCYYGHYRARAFRRARRNHSHTAQRLSAFCLANGYNLSTLPRDDLAAAATYDMALATLGPRMTAKHLGDPARRDERADDWTWLLALNIRGGRLQACATLPARLSLSLAKHRCR